MSQFLYAAAGSEVEEGKPFAVEVDGVEVALIRSEGEVFAIRDECSHAAIALSEGEVGPCEIECWLHGSRFSLRTGEALGPPATEPVATYPVSIDGDDILINVHEPLNATAPR